MKHISSRIAAYTLLYCAVFLCIFVLQFTKGKTFSATAGAMYISGRYEISATGEKIPLLPVHITSNGIDFYVDDQNPLYAVYTDTSNESGQAEDIQKVPLTIQSYTLDNGVFTLDCSDGVRIVFESTIEKDFQAVHIQTVFPEKIEKILLPWKLTHNARIERSSGAILVNTGKELYSFAGNFGLGNPDTDNVSNNEEIPRLTLEKAEPFASYKTYTPFQGLDINILASMNCALPDTYTRAVTAYNSGMLAAAKAAYTSKKITEPLAAAYCAEMGQRGMLESALKNMPAQSLPKTIRTYLTNPFYNNLQNTHNGLIGTRNNKTKRILGFIATENTEVFEEKNILTFLINEGNRKNIEELFKFADRLAVSSLNVQQAAGVIAFWLDCAYYYPQKKIISEEVIAECEKKIIDSLHLIGESLYLSEDGIKVHTAAVCTIAHTLIRYGKQHNTALQAAGRMLITSLLAAQDENANIPASFTLSGNKSAEQTITADNEFLDAAILYPMLNPDTTWYPHEKSLAAGSVEGIWAWTCAQDIEVLEYTQKTMTIKVRFPRESSHYMTLHGILPFYRIEMYGIPFRSDSRFESYNSSGYAYHADSKTLFLKMRHKEEYEIIRLFFGKPPTVRSVGDAQSAQAAPQINSEPKESDSANSTEETSTAAIAPAAADDLQSGLSISDGV